MQRHRHQEFIRFLNTIEVEVLGAKLVHVILDNYATHKHLKVRAWLKRHPRFVFHFTPTSSSWLNAVEGYFAKLTRRRLKRGVFRSVVDLQAAINRFLAETNHEPKPFIWTADPDKIIAAIDRGRQALDSTHELRALLVKRALAARIGDEHETARSSLWYQSARSTLDLGTASSLAAADCRRTTSRHGVATALFRWSCTATHGR